jgi:hypothetical protein
MDLSLGGRGGEGEQGPRQRHGQQGPDDGGHTVFPVSSARQRRLTLSTASTPWARVPASPH